ncbi:cGMP-dependent protein kinase 1-like [Macrobrachium nipponense]|uniref:cGMP-dependent protein kinase 1-like n=1 Tax=Macrobrachium nipponense TaxID=159736 RepID=UPI0030C7C974
MGSLVELQEMLNKKDDRIQQLEAILKVRDDEIVELRSQLDKFQSVMLFAKGPAGTGSGKERTRKTRAQGISAEPQALKTVQELNKLGQTTFPEVPKSSRRHPTTTTSTTNTTNPDSDKPWQQMAS